MHDYTIALIGLLVLAFACEGRCPCPGLPTCAVTWQPECYIIVFDGIACYNTHLTLLSAVCCRGRMSIPKLILDMHINPLVALCTVWHNRLLRRGCLRLEFISSVPMSYLRGFVDWSLENFHVSCSSFEACCSRHGSRTSHISLTTSKLL